MHHVSALRQARLEICVRPSALQTGRVHLMLHAVPRLQCTLLGTADVMYSSRVSSQATLLFSPAHLLPQLCPGLLLLPPW